MIDGGMMGGLGGFGWLGVILNLVISFGVIIGVVVLIVWLVRTVGGGRTTADTLLSQPSGVEILKQRYARGEIDRETYQKILADIG